MENRHSYEDISERLAPCGLDCHRCVAFERGDVRRLATELASALQGFENMAPKVADRVPGLKDYDLFAGILSHFAQAACPGCRAGGGPLPFCAARTCHREQGVDYCFQCGEYPCGRNGYPENLVARWRGNNDRMREAGVEQFYRESLERPRY
jgi:hypothetical protein